jgi:hypothetical protein
MKSIEQTGLEMGENRNENYGQALIRYRRIKRNVTV